MVTKARLAREERRTDVLPVGFSRQHLQPQGWDRLVIHPDSWSVSIYEVFIILCVCYTAVVEPVKVAYQTDIAQSADGALDVIFALDIVVQLLIGFHDSGGSRFPEMRLKVVTLRYLRTWFTIDVIAALPFDKLTSGDSMGTRVPGLIKTVRLVKLKRIMGKWQVLRARSRGASPSDHAA